MTPDELCGTSTVKISAGRQYEYEDDEKRKGERICSQNDALKSKSCFMAYQNNSDTIF
jgi:hypothetical protein